MPVHELGCTQQQKLSFLDQIDRIHALRALEKPFNFFFRLVMVLVEIGNFHEHFGCAQAVSVRLAQKGMCQLILMLFSGIDGTGQIKFINKSVFVVDPVKQAVFFTGKLSGKADRPAFLLE